MTLATPRLGIQMMSSGILQPDIIFNEAMLGFDALVGGTVIDYTITVPGSPATGDTYLIGAAPTGAWTGMAQHVAFFYNGWQFLTAPQHMKLFNQAVGKYYTKSANVWTMDPVSAVTHLADLSDVTAGSPTNGQVLTWVAADTKWEAVSPVKTLVALTDVNVTSIANGQMLKWDAGTSKWVNFTPAASATTLNALTDVHAAGEAAGYIAYWNAGTGKLDFLDPTTLATVPRLNNVGDVAYGAGLTVGDVLAWNGAVWAPSTTISFSFVAMTDGPGTFVGAANKFLRCNALETHLDFVDPPTALVGLTDVNVTEGVGIDGWFLKWDNTTSKWIASLVSGGTLATLTDVMVTEGGGIDGFVLYWNNGASKWEAKALAYTDVSGLATVAHTGAYADLSGAPTIPTTLAALTGDVNVTEGAGIDGKFLKWDNATSKWVAATVTPGATALSSDTDVVIATPANNEVLTYETSSRKWKNKAPTGGGGAGSLATDTDVALSSPANGEVLTFDTGTSKWKNAAPTGGGGGGVGGVFSVGAHRYWKFANIVPYAFSTDAVTIHTMAWFDGVTTLTPVSARCNYYYGGGANPASNLLTGTLGWVGLRGCDLTFDFGSAVSLNKINIETPAAADQTPIMAALFYSDDGEHFTEVCQLDFAVLYGLADHTQPTGSHIYVGLPLPTTMISGATAGNGAGGYILTPPKSADLTALHAHGVTLADNPAGSKPAMVATVPNVGSNVMSQWLHSAVLPSPPYQITYKTTAFFDSAGASWMGGGPLLYNSGNGYVLAGPHNSDGLGRVFTGAWTNDSGGWSSNPSDNTFSQIDVFCRIVNDGTNIIFSVSDDGVNWRDTVTGLISAFILAVTNVGFGFGNASGGTMHYTIEHFHIGNVGDSGLQWSAGAGVLAGMADVNLTSPADGQIIRYDAGTGKWKNDTSKRRFKRPLSADFPTTFNSLGGTLTDVPNGPFPGLALNTPGTGGVNGEQRLQAAPGAAVYSIFAKYRMLNFGLGPNVSGPVVHNSGNNLSLVITFDNAFNQFYVLRLDASGAYTSVGAGPNVLYDTEMIWRIDVNATNITWWLSTDGYTWVQYYQEALATYIGAVTHIGFASGASVLRNVVSMQHWSVNTVDLDPGFLA
jgi:hypothetical protein